MVILKRFNFSRAIFALPFFLIFLANLIITRVQGFNYAGELAVFAGISTFISIFLSMRWDIEILVKNKINLRDSLRKGIMTVVFLSIFLLITFYLINLNYPLHSFSVYLIYSAILIALYELHINIFLKVESIKSFVILRTIPPILLIFFSSLDFSPDRAWFFSYLISLLLLILSVQIYHKEVWTIEFPSLNFLQNFKLMFPPTVSALIANSISVVWLVSIFNYFGSNEAGIWINAYRITSLSIAFCGAVILPLVLVSIGNQISNKDKLFMMLKFSFLLLVIFIFTSLIFLYKGQVIFNLLTNNDSYIDNTFLAIVLTIGTMQYFMQYWKEVFQSINRTTAIMLILLVELLLVILLYFFGINFTLIGFINSLLLITSLSFSFTLILIFISFLKSKSLISQ